MTERTNAVFRDTNSRDWKEREPRSPFWRVGDEE